MNSGYVSASFSASASNFHYWSFSRICACLFHSGEVELNLKFIFMYLNLRKYASSGDMRSSSEKVKSECWVQIPADHHFVHFCTNIFLIEFSPSRGLNKKSILGYLALVGNQARRSGTLNSRSVGHGVANSTV